MIIPKFTPTDRQLLDKLLIKRHDIMYTEMLQKHDRNTAQDLLLQSLPNFCKKELLKKLKDVTF